MPTSRYPDWESFELAPGTGDSPVAFCADLSPASVLGAYQRGIFPLPAADERFRTINEVAYTDGQVTFVHVEHFASQGALLPNWLSGESHERGRLGLLAQAGVRSALG